MSSYPREYVKTLLKKYLERKISPAEKDLLMQIWNLYETKDLSEMMEEIEPTLEPFVDEELEREISEWNPPVEEIIRRGKKEERDKKIRQFIRSLPEAAIYCFLVFMAVFLTWALTRHPLVIEECGRAPGDSDIPTGSYSCKLTLSTNCYMKIDSTFRGIVAQQGNREIIKTEQGVLVYRELDGPVENDTTERMYNTVTTTQGAQYQVLLPDGTKVRLNAASSIRFPVAFSGNGRYVQVKGEAFFEVAPNNDLPFYVRASDAEICVWGTSFNVEAYSANVVTTLVSGSLMLKSGTDTVLLQPGQEAIVRVPNDNNNRRLITISRADTTEALSWKKTIRVYKNIAVKDFVQDMGRWYKLEMVNMDCVPAKSVSTRICYDAPVADVLKLFHQWGLQFKAQGNKIIFCAPA